MKVYDISQEVFGCKVFPGDPAPVRKTELEISKGAVCNLSSFSMCAHNGTHVDAPYHFIDEGKKIDELDINILVGMCYVYEHEGDISSSDALAIVNKARSIDYECAKRILVKGKAVVTLDAAKVFVDEGVMLFGNESQTVGPENAPAAVHNLMLGADKIFLEGIRLSEVTEGEYLLNAAPLNLGGCDGAPCRAVLVDLKN